MLGRIRLRKAVFVCFTCLVCVANFKNIHGFFEASKTSVLRQFCFKKLKVRENTVLSAVFYYIFFGSVILYYGIGVNRLLAYQSDSKGVLISFAKVLLAVLLNVSVDYVFVKYALVPLKMTVLYPVFAIALFSVTIVFVRRLFDSGVFEISQEFLVPFLVIILSLSECTGFLSAVVIASSCVFAFYVFLYLVSSLKLRFHSYDREEGLKPFSLILISLSVVFIAFYAWNCSWLTIGIAAE